jgi:hypothetical protein
MSIFVLARVASAFLILKPFVTIIVIVTAATTPFAR